MSEWLRRQTRNLLGFACAGSNPAVDVAILFLYKSYLELKPQILLSEFVLLRQHNFFYQQ
jgi:hypothetical protein